MRAEPGLDQVKVEEIVSENMVVPMPGVIEGTFELLCYMSLHVVMYFEYF